MASSEEDSGWLVGHMDWSLLSSFGLASIRPVGDILLVMHCLSGPPVLR